MIDPTRIIYLPFDKINHYSDLCKVIRNHWWSVDPEKGLIFYGYGGRRKVDIKHAFAQCNSNREISERLTKQLWPEAECRFVELVIVPIDVHEYAN